MKTVRSAIADSCANLQELTAFNIHPLSDGCSRMLCPLNLSPVVKIKGRG